MDLARWIGEQDLGYAVLVFCGLLVLLAYAV